MKSEFLISGVETGQLNAMVKNIMVQTGITDPKEAVRLMNYNELRVSVIKQKWTEKDGVIRFSVTSDGTTGEQWIERLESKGHRISEYAKSILRSQEFKPTSDIIYEIAVLKGELFNDKDRVTTKIRQEAKDCQLGTPNVEIACLIREKFSNKELKEMGLYWIVIMHEPIKDSDGDPRLLSVDRGGDGSWLGTYFGNPDVKWHRDSGFAFDVS